MVVIPKELYIDNFKFVCLEHNDEDEHILINAFNNLKIITFINSELTFNEVEYNGFITTTSSFYPNSKSFILSVGMYPNSKNHKQEIFRKTLEYNFGTELESIW